MSLPVFDVSLLISGTPEQRLERCKSFTAALTRDGITKITNTQLDDEEMSSVFRGCKDFFHLPIDTKKTISNDPTHAQQRGWSKLGDEKTWYLESNKGNIDAPIFGDAKESFDVGAKSDVQFPNRWLSESVQGGLKNTLEDYFEHCAQLSNQLLEALAVGLDLPSSTFTERCSHEASTLRANHYPTINASQLEDGKVSRVWPHHDFGIISLVFPSTVGGLEYGDRQNPGNFLPILYNSQREIVVLVSETFQRWTNGVVRAGLHQVTKPAAEEILSGGVLPERTSLVFFCKADRNVSVAPLPKFKDVNNDKVYDDITALEYQSRRNEAHYPDIQIPIIGVH